MVSEYQKMLLSYLNMVSENVTELFVIKLRNLAMGNLS
jgi:hypothetical protein